jgi:phytoene synthase
MTPAASDAGDLDALVRRVDEDRWLASRFISDEAARADVIALYALNYELSRAAEVASQPLIGEMRLAWWREAIAELFEGGPVRRHPVALALAGAAGRRGLTREVLEALVDARLRELEPWPLGEEEALAYIDATAGGLMALAARVLSPDAAAEQTRHAARAWGLAGLARRGGRLPPAWGPQDVRLKVGEGLNVAAQELKALPVAAFPAAAYAALARTYAAGTIPSELSRRARMTWAVVRGRL